MSKCVYIFWATLYFRSICQVTLRLRRLGGFYYMFLNCNELDQKSLLLDSLQRNKVQINDYLTPKDPSVMDIAAVFPCLEISLTNRHRCRVFLRCQGTDRKVRYVKCLVRSLQYRRCSPGCTISCVVSITYSRRKTHTSTGMRRIMMFRSKTHRIYDGGPITL